MRRPSSTVSFSFVSFAANVVVVKCFDFLCFSADGIATFSVLQTQVCLCRHGHTTNFFYFSSPFAVTQSAGEWGLQLPSAHACVPIIFCTKLISTDLVGGRRWHTPREARGRTE